MASTLAVAIVVCTVATEASVMRRVSLDELAAHSSTVIVARCRGAQSRWTNDGRQIVTEATYEVVDALKGSPGRRVTVSTLGGVVDGIAMHVAGMPTFEVGRQEVLFLADATGSTMKIVGLSQGQFIVSAPGTAKARVGRKLAGIDLVGPKDSRLEPQPLQRFIRSLRDHIR